MALILIVEKDLGSADLLTSVLKIYGHASVYAATAEAGLQLLASLKPDLVITEWLLPDRSGQQFCQAIGQVPGMKGTAPAILVLTIDHELERETVLAAGGGELMQKPFSLPRLRDCIDALLPTTASLHPGAGSEVLLSRS